MKPKLAINKWNHFIGLWSCDDRLAIVVARAHRLAQNESGAQLALNIEIESFYGARTLFIAYMTTFELFPSNVETV